MAYSLTKFLKLLVVPIVGALVLGYAGSVYAQSSNASPVAQEATRRTPAAQNRQNSGPDTGRRAISRNATASANAAPVALALEDAGPAPASTPEPLTIALVGGAMAGLYGLRKHLS